MLFLLRVTKHPVLCPPSRSSFPVVREDSAVADVPRRQRTKARVSNPKESASREEGLPAPPNDRLEPPSSGNRREEGGAARVRVQAPRNLVSVCLLKHPHGPGVGRMRERRAVCGGGRSSRPV